MRINRPDGTGPIDPNQLNNNQPQEAAKAGANSAQGPTVKKLPEHFGMPNNPAASAYFAATQIDPEDVTPSNLDDGLGVQGIGTATILNRVAEMDLERVQQELDPSTYEALLTGNMS